MFQTDVLLPIGKFLRQLQGILLFPPEVSMQVKDLLMLLGTDKSIEPLLQFLRIMHTLSEIGDTIQIEEIVTASAGSWQLAVRINKVKNYVAENYQKQIKIEEVAGIVGLSLNSFSGFLNTVPDRHLSIMSIR